MDKNTQIVIVEDDWVIAQELKALLVSMGYHVATHISEGEKLLEYLESNSADVILLDIELAGVLNGIQTANLLKKAFQIPFIFLTALSDATTLDKAKITEPASYLVKPVNVKDLQSAIELTLYKHQNQKNIAPQPTEIGNDLFVKVKNRLEKINFKNILWIEAKDIYAAIKTLEGHYVVSHSLKELEKILPANTFMRVHRSFIVAIDKIDAIEDGNLVMGKDYIPVGKTYKAQLWEKLNIL